MGAPSRETAAALLVLAGGLIAPPSPAQTAFNVTLVERQPFVDAADVAGAGDLAFVALREGGLAIVDLSVVGFPDVVSVWQHPTAEMDIVDARPQGSMVWAANQSNDTFSVVGIDVSDPANPVTVVELGAPEILPKVHNLAVDDTHLYLAGFGDGQGNHIVDVTDPANPVVVATIEVGMHDNAIVDDRLYTSGGYDGFFLHDVSDPANPVLLTSWTANTADTLYYTHNAWPIDETHVLVTEEVQLPADDGSFTQGSVRILDIGDLESPTEVWRWRSASAVADPLVTPHNGFVVDGFLYLSHYQDGLKVFDVSDPAAPVEVGFYDTFPDPPSALFEGCWGNDPFGGPDRILLSDRAHGLFRVAFNGARKAALAGVVRDADTLDPIDGARVESLTALRFDLAASNGAYRLDTGAGDHAIRVSAPGYLPHVEIVALGDLATVILDVDLPSQTVDVAISPPSPVRVGPPVPNPFRAETRFTAWSVDGGQIEVFDAAGRRVRTFNLQPTPAEGRALTWDGRSDAGVRVPAGVYFVGGPGIGSGGVRRVLRVP